MQVNLTIPTSCASNQTAEQVAQSARSTSPRPRTPEGTCARHTWAPHSPAKRAGSGSRMRELSNCIGSPVLIGLQWLLNNAYPHTPQPFVCAEFDKIIHRKGWFYPVPVLYLPSRPKEWTFPERTYEAVPWSQMIWTCLWTREINFFGISCIVLELSAKRVHLGSLSKTF